MSDFKLFFKQNKKIKENVKLAVTKSLVDENNEPLLWEIRPVSTRENELIRNECTKKVAVNKKKGLFLPEFDADKYIAKLICKSIVFPNLNDKELQDSYGVMGAEELLKEMVNEAGEYANLSEFVQTFNGFDIDIDDKVEEAKN